MAEPLTSARAWGSTEDTARMAALASRRLARDWPAVRLHPGDLDWWTVHAWGRERGFPDLGERIRLWPGEGPGGGPGLLAFAWYGPPGDLDVLLGNELVAGDGDRARAILEDALAWGAGLRDRYAPGRGDPILAWAAEGGPEARLLESLGRRPRPGEHAFVQLTGRVGPSAVDPVAPPPGLVVRPLTDEDVEARVICSRAAFTTSTMTPERYRRVSLGRVYRPELDLVVVDGTGAVVAFALGWYDEATAIVELEPVGVHPSHHRRGLGTLVCRSVLAAAEQIGATRAMVAADSDNAAAIGLYRSIGLAVTSSIVGFVPAADPAAS